MRKIKTIQEEKLIAGIKERELNMTPEKIENYLRFLSSVGNVAEFYYKDERKHYECNRSKDHIFHHIKIMLEFLEIDPDVRLTTPGSFRKQKALASSIILNKRKD